MKGQSANSHRVEHGPDELMAGSLMNPTQAHGTFGARYDEMGTMLRYQQNRARLGWCCRVGGMEQCYLHAE